MEMIKPKRLHRGSTIGIIAPCYRVREEDIAVSVARLRALGFKVKYAPHLFSTAHGYAGTPEERAADFNAMIADDEVDMLLFGGGEVCGEILSLVDFDAVRRHPKLISSYSDSTSILNAVAARAGVVTYYGQSLRPFTGDGLSPYNAHFWRETFLEEDMPVHIKGSAWKSLHGGRFTGRTIGGYLVNFYHLLGTPYLPLEPGERRLLILEDHAKFNKQAAVSNYLTLMEQCGFMEQVGGVIFGEYSPNPSPDLEARLTRLGEKYDIPVIKCDDFGHGANQAILPIGVHATLDADAQSLRYTEPVTQR